MNLVYKNQKLELTHNSFGLLDSFDKNKEEEKENTKRDPKSRHTPSPPASARGGNSEISESPNTRRNTSVVP